MSARRLPLTTPLARRAALLLAGALAATAASPAGAQMPLPGTLPSARSAFNVGASPIAAPLELSSVGWFYTPSSSFVLTSILTWFADLGADGAPRDVTIDVYGADATTPTLGALLGSASLASATATGRWGGASFAGQGIALAAGTRYFVGFRDVGYADPATYTGGLGTNVTGAPTGGSGGVLGDLLVEDAVAGTGPYTYHIPAADAGDFAQPLLRIEGVDAAPPVTSAPEPATLLLVGAGLAGVVVVGRRRRG